MAYVKKKQSKDSSAFQKFKKDLKDNQLAQLYIFHGEESYLKEFYLSEVKKALLPSGLEEFNLHVIPNKECSPKVLSDTVDCLPMMSERTLILITDYDLFGGGAQQREQYIQLFDTLPDYCCIIFLYDLLPFKSSAPKLAASIKAHGAIVPFQRQEQSDLIAWITRHFRADGHEISTENARYLIFLCGDLMTKLSSEIGKISAYAKQKQISRQDIDAVAIPQVEAKVFQMTDAIARKDFEQTAQVLNDLFANRENAIRILFVLGQYFRQLYTARLAYESGQTVQYVMDIWNMDSKNAWRAERLLNSARKFTLPWCRNAVARCAQTDLMLKSQSCDENQLLTSLVMELANF